MGCFVHDRNDLQNHVGDDNTLNPSLLSGKNVTIRLKPGEQLSEFTRKANKITFVRQSGSGMVRLLGV